MRKFSVPARPTKATTAVNLELPTELVERLRNFAKQDMRSIKAEVIRAIRLLLDTCDRPDAVLAGPIVPPGTSSADTLKGDTSSPYAAAPTEPPFNIAGLSDEKFAGFLENLKGGKYQSNDIVMARRRRRTVEQIASENRRRPDAVRPVVEKLERMAAREAQK